MSDPYFDGTIPLPGFSGEDGSWNGRDTIVYGRPGADGVRPVIYEDHEGNTPFIGIPDGGNFFASHDPAAISEYRHDARTRNWQGIASIVTLVGGAAALGAATAGGATPGLTGSATVSGSNAAAGVAGGASGAGATSAFIPGYGLTAAQVAAGSGAAAAPSLVAAGGKFSKVLGFLSRNKDLIGSVIGGIGESMAADRAAENNLDVLRERQNLTAANYAGAKPKFRGLAPGTSTVNPMERFDRYSGFEYVYDAALGRIVKQPVEQSAPQQ